METTQIDAGEFRSRQRRDWGSAAQAWHDWQELMVAATAPVSKRLVELAQIKPADRVLDVGAGVGEPALTAARIVGPEGEVIATDISQEMLSFARTHAASAGIDNVDFVEAHASALDFPPESFDAGLSRWGIIFEPEAEAAATRIRSFLKPGARMAISSWGPPERVPMLALPMGTVMKRLNVPPPSPGTPGSALAADARGDRRAARRRRIRRCGGRGARGRARMGVPRRVRALHARDRATDHGADGEPCAGGPGRNLASRCRSGRVTRRRRREAPPQESRAYRRGTCLAPHERPCPAARCRISGMCRGRGIPGGA
jgi:SAM-dependent methyltransferase